MIYFIVFNYSRRILLLLLGDNSRRTDKLAVVDLVIYTIFISISNEVVVVNSYAHSCCIRFGNNLAIVLLRVVALIAEFQ